MKTWIGKWVVVVGVLVAVGWSGSAMAGTTHDHQGMAPAVKAEGGAIQAPAGKGESAAPPAEVAKGCKKCMQGMKAEAGAVPAKPAEKTAVTEQTQSPVEG